LFYCSCADAYDKTKVCFKGFAKTAIKQKFVLLQFYFTFIAVVRTDLGGAKALEYL